MPKKEKKQMDIPEIFKSDAEDIKREREKAIKVHKTNIRAAGNQVEKCVRDYFRRMLPPRYYVTEGHLIDINGNISPQLDIIIADNFNVPSLMTLKDGTEYIPIDSVYAIGEIKSTYSNTRRKKNPRTLIEEFSSNLEDIKERLYHEEVPNTVYGGHGPNSLLRDLILGKRTRILNRIFSFIVFVDATTFQFKHISEFYTSRNNKYLPNIMILLNKGVVVFGSENERPLFNYYPEDRRSEEEAWCYFPCMGDGSGNGSLEGNHLAFLYHSVLEHLSNSYLEPPSLIKYTYRMLATSKSMIEKANVKA
ncbi:MAG TPA: DUF6602 domain-containing protein [Blastocatellia bacterium]|nr:DUF6602 domain-containing protein [Blastocatellia bacterium]